MICKDLKGFARICKDLQGFARICNDLQGFARLCKALQGFARICKDLQGCARMCKALQGFGALMLPSCCPHVALLLPSGCPLLLPGRAPLVAPLCPGGASSRNCLTPLFRDPAILYSWCTLPTALILCVSLWGTNRSRWVTDLLTTTISAYLHNGLDPSCKVRALR